MSCVSEFQRLRPDQQNQASDKSQQQSTPADPNKQGQPNQQSGNKTSEGQTGGGKSGPGKDGLPSDVNKLKGGQGYRDKDGNTWKKDKLHKDHWDVSNKKGDKIKEVDFDGKQIWPDGPKNKNK